MLESYKIRTYPTLYPWIPIHKQIIEKYEKCPNKSEFVRRALEYFAESGFPGLQEDLSHVQNNTRQIQERTKGQRKVEVDDDDPLSEL